MENTITITQFGLWHDPVFIKAIEVGESVEFIYKQDSMIQNLSWSLTPLEQRVFKIVFSCKDGKWHKSEPIYGKIIKATAESYEFE